MPPQNFWPTQIFGLATLVCRTAMEYTKKCGAALQWKLALIHSQNGQEEQQARNQEGNRAINP